MAAVKDFLSDTAATFSITATGETTMNTMSNKQQNKRIERLLAALRKVSLPIYKELKIHAFGEYHQRRRKREMTRDDYSRYCSSVSNDTMDRWVRDFVRKNGLYGAVLAKIKELVSVGEYNQIRFFVENGNPAVEKKPRQEPRL